MNAPMLRAPQTAAIKVLVVDDDPLILKVWRVILRSDEFEVFPVASAQEALQIVAASRIDVVVTDVMMPVMDGMELLRRLKQGRPEIEVIVMTGKGSIQDAVKAMREGAFDYLTKPFNEIEECVNRVRQAARLKRLHDENQALRDQVDASPSGALVDSVAPAMKPISALVNQVAKVNSTVIITGPTGTGKSAIARSIHDRSPRKDGPFVHVDCGVLPNNLMASELFGHVPGAFTGAVSRKEGLFQAANNGTIFLDEIGNLDREAQTNLLRVLQDGVFRPLGETKDSKVNVRVVAATNADLQQAIAEGSFREDLFFRLRVVEVRMPPLNDRREDIPRLAYHFLRRHTARNGKTIKNIGAQCMELLRAHDWKGNIRELDNAIERAVIVEPSDELTGKSLPPEIGSKPQAGPAVDPLLGHVDLTLSMRDATERAESAIRVAYLSGVMAKFKNVAAGARHANVERSNFRRLLKKYGIPYQGGHVEKRDDDDDDDDE